MTIKKSVISMPSGDLKSWMKISPLMLAMLASVPVSAAVYEDDEDEADYSEVALVTQRINQFSNVVDFRLRYLADDAFKFGEYNSQEGKGWQLDGSFDLEQRDFEDGTARYLRAEGNSIGTKSRDITLEAGQQGDHKFVLSFDGIEKQSHGNFTPSYVADPAAPYSFAAVTAGSVVNVPVIAYRERLGLLFKKQAGNNWRFSADVNRENKSGNRDYTNSTLFYAYPIDYTTSNVNLTAEYVAKSYQFQLGYELSQFDNAGESVTGVGAVEQVQEPDSVIQTLFWNGIYRLSDKTRVNAYLSYAMAEQNEDLIGAGGNATRTTADAEVNNFIARLGVSSRITNKLSAEAKYEYRDNDTKTEVFEVDTTDASKRRTPVFDTTWESLSLGASYRLPKASKVSVGYKHEKIERPASDRKETEEDKLWATYQLPMMGRFSGTFKLSAADRHGSEYLINTIEVFRRSVTWATIQDGTQRLNYADREQIKGQFRGQYQLGSTGYVGMMLQAWNDDYNQAELGLQEADGQMYTLDFGASPMRELSYSLYAGIQSVSYDQIGSDNGDRNVALIDPSDVWSQETNDKGLFTGFHIDWEVIPDKVKTGLDYRYTKTTGELEQQPAATDAVINLADIESKVHRVELTGEYFLDKQTTFVARAVYEDYESSSWAYETNYQNAGYKDPNHSAALIELGMRYQF